MGKRPGVKHFLPPVHQVDMDVPVEVERSDAVPVTVLARVRQGDHAAFTELVVAYDADMGAPLHGHLPRPGSGA